MVYMTKSRYDYKLAKLKRKNEGIERRRKLREEKMKYWPRFIMPSTSKVVLIVAALLCVEILIFCQYMIMQTGDSNALYAMVGVVVSLASIVLGYFVKSTKENTEGGLVYQATIEKIKKENNAVEESAEMHG